MKFRLLLASALLVSTAASGALAAPFRILTLEQHQLKWGEAKLGAPARVTYRIASGAERYAGAINCRAIQPVAPLLAANKIDEAAFHTELEAAFTAWSQYAAIDFVPATGGEADIVIGAQAEPRGRAFTNVEYGRDASRNSTRSLDRALICLNPAMPWKVGFDGNLNVYDLRYALMHEIGHAIGLDHPAIDQAIMNFRYNEQFRELQPADVAGAVALYGPRGAVNASAEAGVALTAR